MTRLPKAEVIVFICKLSMKDLMETLYLFDVTDMIIVPVQNTVMHFFPVYSSCVSVNPPYIVLHKRCVIVSALLL